MSYIAARQVMEHIALKALAVNVLPDQVPKPDAMDENSSAVSMEIESVDTDSIPAGHMEVASSKAGVRNANPEALLHKASSSADTIDWNRGALRLWLIIAVPWVVYFGWSGYNGYSGYNLAQNSANDCSKRIDIALQREEVATTPQEKSFARESRADNEFLLQNYCRIRDDYKEQLETAYTWGPAIPLGFPVAWFLGRWVLQGLQPRSRGNRRSTRTQE